MNPVVIDTNCLLQIISRRSPYRPIWDAFLAGRFTLCASDEILDEYQEILEQQISPTVAENVVTRTSTWASSQPTRTIISLWIVPLLPVPTI